MKFKLICAGLLAILGLSTVIAQEMTEEEKAIAERIKPVAKVNLASAAAQGAAGARTGQQIYDQACAACHTPGILGAPKNQVAADWQPRLDEKGFDGVWQNAINGINAMPPMGACGDCSEDDIKIAIEYMIEGI